MESEIQGTAFEPQDTEPGKKIYYSIKEVAALLGETEHTLRFWEEVFPDDIKPKRNKRSKRGGIRFYKEEDIEDIRLIQHYLRDSRLTIDGVRKRLKNNPDSSKRKDKVVLRLKKIKTELKELGKVMNEIESLRRTKQIAVIVRNEAI